MFMHGGLPICSSTCLPFGCSAVYSSRSGAETLPVLLPRMRHRCRAYPGACTIHPLRNGAFRIRQCQYRVFHHPHGRISQHDDYRRSLGAVYAILLGFGMLFPNQPMFVFPLPFPIKAKYFVIGCLDRIILGTCQQSGRQCGALCTFGRYDIRIHSNNVLEKKGQRKWLLL